MPEQKSIAIIGSGLIGLSTAYLALKDGHDVTIYSDKPSTDTVSMIAGASFKLHKVGFVENIEGMIKDTWDEYDRHEDKPGQTPGSGVRLGRHMVASMNPLSETEMQHLSVVKDVKRYPQDDAVYKIPGGYEYGISYVTFHINPQLFIPYLVSKIEAMGGRFQQRFFNNEQELEELPEGTIINCAGFGAQKLCNDDNIKPLKGQLVLTDYPESDLKKALGDLDSISADGFYIYPHPEQKVPNGRIAVSLGGTAEQTSDITTDDAITTKILEGNGRILRNLEARQVIAGLRPCRDDGPRIDMRHIGNKLVIDNYGHGGSGYTLCWGSAKRVLQLIT